MQTVWQVIHRILNPNTQRIYIDPEVLNNHFTSTVERTLGQSQSQSNEELFSYIRV